MLAISSLSLVERSLLGARTLAATYAKHDARAAAALREAADGAERLLSGLGPSLSFDSDGDAAAVVGADGDGGTERGAVAGQGPRGATAVASAAAAAAAVATAGERRRRRRASCRVEVRQMHSQRFCHSLLKGLRAGERAADVVIVDPPRAGLDADTIALIAEHRTIMYISCMPSSLVRDLGLLPGFEVREAVVFDQFAHTSEHLEVGVWLERKSA